MTPSRQVTVLSECVRLKMLGIDHEITCKFELNEEKNWLIDLTNFSLYTVYLIEIIYFKMNQAFDFASGTCLNLSFRSYSA